MTDPGAWQKRNYDDDDDDNTNLREPSGSGDISDMYDTYTTQDTSLSSLSETAPDVDAVPDDETNLYLYIVAAVVAAVVFIFVIVILIVSIRKRNTDKKKIPQCDRTNLQAVKVHTEANNSTRGTINKASLPDVYNQARTEQGNKPSPHRPMMATTARPHMS